MLPVPGRTTFSRLASLVLACVLPIWITAGVVLHHAYEFKKALVEQSLVQTARSLSLTLDRELGGIQSALRALATSPSLASGDFAAFHNEMREILRDYPGADLILADETGQQLANSFQSFGRPLPRRSNIDGVRQVFATGKPVISDLYKGALTGRWLIAVDIPVIRDQKVVLDLAMALPSDRLAMILLSHSLPPQARATLLDSRHVVAGRTHRAEAFVGRPAGTDFLERVGQMEEGTVETTNLEGIRVVDAFIRSPVSGWMVVVGVPTEVFFAQLWRWLAWSLAELVLLSALGLGLAVAIARSIARSINALVAPARAVGHGEAVTVPRLDLRETDEVGQALLTASRLLQQRAAERDGVERILTERTALARRQYERLRSLSDIASLPRAGSAQQLGEALVLGSLHLGLPVGAISRIENKRFTIQHLTAPPEANLHEGMVFDLSQTYSALVCQDADVVCIAHMSASPWAGQPCFGLFGLESYIGALVQVRGRRYGTVSFSSGKPYPRDFDDGDREFMRLLARWIGVVLERQEIHDDLARSNADLEQFAHIASHDLREPLRQVSSYVTLLERRHGAKLEGEALDFIRYAREAAKRMDRLILDLLDYSCIGRGDRPMARLSSAEVLAEALRTLGPEIAAAGARIDLPETLPPLTGERGELVQLFLNLITNAVTYRAKERPPVIVIRVRREEEVWVFSIKDNGIGIEAQYYDRIFGIFQRLHGHDEYEGTGIGLAACKKIVERHHGRIWLQSQPGEGTEFLVTLPVAPDVGAPRDEARRIETIFGA